MFFSDHNPPHFHAVYQDSEAIIDINTLSILEGSLPKRAQVMVLEWAFEHRTELLENWNKAQKPESLNKIEPLN